MSWIISKKDKRRLWNYSVKYGKVLSHEELLEKIVNYDCCYVIYNFIYDDKDNKIMFITWIPKESKIKNKLLTAE